MKMRACQPEGVRKADNCRKAVSFLALAVVIPLLGLGPSRVEPAAAQDDGGTTSTLPGVGDTIPAPSVEVAGDGLSATDGVRTLTVSAAKDLAVAGAAVTVTGSGYDTSKGIYLAFCKAMPEGETPTPCGGGAALEGSTGASQWISSNPPPYGRGLAIPYGPGGTFSVQLTVAPEISDEVDCLETQCVVTSRNDHTRTTDHSQDISVPVGFVGTPFPTTTTTSAPDVAVGGSSGSDDGWLVPVAVGVGVAALIAGGIAIGRRRAS